MLSKLLRPVHHLFVYRVELDQRLERHRNEIVSQGVIRVEWLTKDFTEPPVVRYFVIIPLDVDGNFREEALHFVISVIVLPVSPSQARRN